MDIDKIIEEERKGLYTGIGVGGREEKKGCCYARKCEVEEKFLDGDSEDEWTGKSGEEEDEENGHEDEWTGKKGEEEDEEDEHEDEEVVAAEDKSKKEGSDKSDGKANGDIG